ncbi:Arm DNA-binding domain-containing protein [Paraburkholderia caffeinilytica]|uniref:Integrase DNA-binding domain-containing protein n=1 Tax=Paraburkholderia caffeinilytica TaxID=1761016 RepID=A0ABQ1MWR1_9BURK|nr:Arm DNA-binding domain-containing protein [Paraburkholderia caffeinilytica]GGC48144.1 hypothetical protein GCM10011400_39270 [Paraburkholderia caffeinilytica]CAB3782596.1 hypothetical protein LMG28690_01403 [Paraburkholderia caffeinilytica]
MKLTYPLLLNAKPQDKPYKIRDRDSMYLRVSVSGSTVWKFDYRLDGKDCSYTLSGFIHFPILRDHPGNVTKPAAGFLQYSIIFDACSWSPPKLNAVTRLLTVLPLVHSHMRQVPDVGRGHWREQLTRGSRLPLPVRSSRQRDR